MRAKRGFFIVPSCPVNMPVGGIFDAAPASYKDMMNFL
jgi:hypothetical protein